MFGTILSLVAPIILQVIGWVLNYIQAGDQTKQQFYLFIAAWEAELGTSVNLSNDARAQIQRMQADLAKPAAEVVPQIDQPKS